MKIDIQTHGFTLTDALRTQTERRLRFAFGGLGARVGRVGVRLTDENGPRGGVDKRCALRITVPGQQPIVIEQQESNLYVAIDSAAERAGRAVSRQVGRQQAQRRDAPWQDLSQ